MYSSSCFSVTGSTSGISTSPVRGVYIYFDKYFFIHLQLFFILLSIPLVQFIFVIFYIGIRGNSTISTISTIFTVSTISTIFTISTISTIFTISTIPV